MMRMIVIVVANAMLWPARGGADEEQGREMQGGGARVRLSRRGCSLVAMDNGHDRRKAGLLRACQRPTPLNMSAFVRADKLFVSAD